jgi:hypothetical protein
MITIFLSSYQRFEQDCSYALSRYIAIGSHPKAFAVAAT